MGTSAAARTNFHTDATTKRVAEQLFGEFKLDMSTAFSMFSKQSIREQALPIRPAISHISNATTMQAIEHVEAIRKGEIPENGAALDNVDDAIELLGTLV